MNETDTFYLDCDGLEVTNTSMKFDHLWNVTHRWEQTGSRIKVITTPAMKSAYDIDFNISFTGDIRSDLSGFYRSTYIYNGIQRFLASTHFESSSARKAFPCFDEPSFRADFSLELHLDPGWTAISNTPLLQSQLSENKTRLNFAEHKNIPSYLIAWVIFEESGFSKSPTLQINSSCSSGSNYTNYTLWSNRAYGDQFKLALLAAPVFVNALENFTGIKCKAVKEKVDLVAIPDFSAGAMENWGLITFKENALLFDENYSSAFDKQQILMIVAHELAHQWFGNLVTPQWWSYTWLSEGFARYLQYFIPHKDFPQLRLDEQFVVDRRQIALEQDNLQSHPLTNENITTQSDIDNMFDIITYDKGASIIHMMKSLLGKEFDAGINNYLNRVDGAGGVTTPDWFFSSFPSLPSLMRRWTETSGYPIIIASEINSTLSLRQIKITGWNKVNTSDWLVPISISIDGNVSWHHLQPNQSSLNIPLHVNSTYFINVNQTGYYRVMYLNWTRWKAENVSSLTRSQLIDDVMALAYGGLLSFHEALPITQHHLTSDLDYLTWRTGLRTLTRLGSLLEGSSLEGNFTGRVLSWMGGVIDYIAFNDTQNMTLPLQLHQVNILRHACKFGHEKCLKAADQLALNISGSTAEVRSALLCTVVRRGNTTTWEEVLRRYETANSPAESQLMLNSLACTTDRTILQRLLNLLFTERIRKHNIKPMISLICSNRVGAGETLLFLKNNLVMIYNYFGETRSVMNILYSATTYINDTILHELQQNGVMLQSAVPQLQLDSFFKNLEMSISWKKNVLRFLTAFLSGEPVPTTSTVTSSPATVTTSTKKPAVNPSNGSNRNEAQYIFIFLIIPVLCLYKIVL